MITEENKKVKIVFWGTSEFAIPVLEALFRAGYSVAAVVTTPDKPAGRKQIFTPPPVKIWVTKHKTQNTIEILQPEKLDKSFMLHVSSFMPDIFIVAAYGKMIPADILVIPTYSALNIHPSLLPRWRGPSPIQYTILNGDTETGVTIMKVDEKMDNGPIAAKKKWQIANNQTYIELHDTLAKSGAELLVKILPRYLAGEIMLTPQNESKATYSKLLTKEDGHIDWSRSAEEIERMVRAFQPWPGAYSYWWRSEKKLKIDILQAQPTTNNPRASHLASQQPTTDDTPGVVKKCDGNLCVQTGNGLLEIMELQIEGKKPTNVQSFLNGYSEIIGQIFM